MLMTSTRSLVQQPGTRLDRARDLVLYLEQAADLADLTAQIVGELEGATQIFLIGRDHAIAVQIALVAMLDQAIADGCELEGLNNDFRLAGAATAGGGRASQNAAVEPQQ